ncbi:hypothetical protein FJR05_22295, partial [Dolichospermum sp. UHCC 0259]|nr:hypothetical protein [Dolichospermum sp. UHCC 0259]
PTSTYPINSRKWGESEKLPSNLLTALSIAKDIEVQLDFHQQLWLIDYLQYCWKEFLCDHNWLLKLEDAKNSLLKMASPRLVWEVLLFPD